MDIANAPLLGTPKQNAFICRLAASLGYPSLAEACNKALGRPLSSALPSPFPVADASAVIAALLAEAQVRGVSIGFSKKGNGGRRGGKRKTAKVATARSAGKGGQATTSVDAAAVLAGADTAALVATLESRGIPAALAAGNPDLVGGAATLLQAAARCVVAWEESSAGLQGALCAAVAVLRAAIENTGADLAEAANLPAHLSLAA